MSLKILYIEDDMLSIRLVQKVLQGTNTELQTALNAEDGLQLAHIDSPDLIIVDANLPGGMDGIEAIRQIKAISHLKHIPVIMLTADFHHNTFTQSQQAGCDYYMEKPVRQSTLYHTITQELGLSM